MVILVVIYIYIALKYVPKSGDPVSWKWVGNQVRATEVNIVQFIKFENSNFR